MAKPTRPTKPPPDQSRGVTGAPSQLLNAHVPEEISQAWVQFMRSDVADAVNGLNNRLNVILAATSEIKPESLSRDEQRELERIRTEVERAVRITSRLLKRVDLMAPETIPHLLAPFSEPPTRTAHIVVVEDDDANRAVITRLLQRLGHQVTPCANGYEALEAVQLGPVDCVVCDLNMPKLGGRGFFEQAEERMPNLAGRFVFVTGAYSDPESRTFLEKSGQPFVAKPYEISELLGAIATILRRVGVLTEPR